MFLSPLLPLLVFLIAVLYSSAGFGGASGYLLVMHWFGIPVNLMASTALALNIVVSSIAFASYARAGYFRPRLLIPFLVASIPAAFIGAQFKVSSSTYASLLYLVLFYLAVRMLLFPSVSEKPGWQRRPVPLWAALISGSAIGLLSGILGIGGGIFLSPLILVMGWGNAKEAATASGGFIALNSLSGLIGRATNGTLALDTSGLVLLGFGIIGALIGGQLGAGKLSTAGVRRALGTVLLIAVGIYWFKR